MRDGSLTSLSDEQISRYEMMLYNPESYTEKEVDDSFFNSWLDEIERMGI